MVLRLSKRRSRSGNLYLSILIIGWLRSFFRSFISLSLLQSDPSQRISNWTSPYRLWLWLQNKWPLNACSHQCSFKLSLELLHLSSFAWAPLLELLCLSSFAWGPSLELLCLSSFTWAPLLELLCLSSFAWAPLLELLCLSSSAWARLLELSLKLSLLSSLS